MPRAARRQEIPTERTVADGALENQYRRVQRIAELMANAGFDADLVTRNSQPIVATHATAAVRTAAALRVDIAHVHPLGPVARFIHHEGVEVFFFDGIFQRTFLVALDLSHFQRVRLAHDQEHLDRLAHVRWLAIGIWKILCH